MRGVENMQHYREYQIENKTIRWIRKKSGLFALRFAFCVYFFCGRRSFIAITTNTHVCGCLLYAVKNVCRAFFPRILIAAAAVAAVFFLR